MKNSGLVTLISIALLIGWTAPTFADSAESLFHEAILKQSGERDFPAAIELYKQVMQQAGEKSALAAEANLQIGLCYETMGKKQEALSAYQTVLASGSGATDDVTKTARQHVGQIEAEIAADAAAERAKTSAAGSAKPADSDALGAAGLRPYSPRWVLDLEGGYTILQTHADVLSNISDPFEHRYDVAWGGLGYRLTKHLQLGIEGGNLFERESDESFSSNVSYSDGSNYSDNSETTVRSSHYYIGAYVQDNADFKRLSFQGRLGAGVMQTNVDEGNTQMSENCYPTSGPVPALSPACTVVNNSYSANYQATDPAMTMSLAAEYKLSPHVGISLGVRNILLFVHETVYSYSQTEGLTPGGGSISYSSNSDYKLVSRDLLMPFGRLSFMF